MEALIWITHEGWAVELYKPTEPHPDCQSRWHVFPTDFEGSFQEIRTALIRLGADYSSRIQRIAIVVEGFVNLERTHIAYWPAMPGWIEVPIASRFAQAFDCPVVLGNTADIVALQAMQAGLTPESLIVHWDDVLDIRWIGHVAQEAFVRMSTAHINIAGGLDQPCWCGHMHCAADAIQTAYEQGDLDETGTLLRRLVECFLGVLGVSELVLSGTRFSEPLTDEWLILTLGSNLIIGPRKPKRSPVLLRL